MGHSVMYMYFFLMTFPAAARLVKPVAPLITVIQIVQMVWGLVVNAIAIGTYFNLFSQLFFEAQGSSKKEKKQFARTLSRKISQVLLEDHIAEDPSAEPRNEEDEKKRA